MIPMDPMTLGIGLLIWQSFRRQSNSEYGVMTPGREEVYRNAMEKLTNPQKLIKIAGIFERYGLAPQANVLKIRAKWHARPQNVRDQHREIFDKAMASTNPIAILKVANVFERMTATVLAAKLRARVDELGRLALEKEKEEQETITGDNPDPAPKVASIRGRRRNSQVSESEE